MAGAATRAWAALLLPVPLACAPAQRGEPLVPPVERNAYARPSRSAEIAASLAAIARRHPDVAALVPLGRSALGRPLQALLLGRDVAALRRGDRSSGRLVVLLVGSQHGNEPSGGEALLRLAAGVAAGGRGELDAYDLIVIPDANPDGRDLHRRGNGDGVNLSTNYVTLSAPESRALAERLRDWQPDVVVDVHESAIFKPSTLARQGYLTDFEAQIGVANDANLDPALRALSRLLLADMLARIEQAGLPANEYIGEITDLDQPITHGGTSARNLRNAAGIRGALSFLLENRLDPTSGDYPTPRNLRARVDKQQLCVEAMLAVCRTHRAEILRRAAAARQRYAGGRAPVQLATLPAPDPNRPFIDIRLRRLDGTPEVRRFAYRGAVIGTHALAMPRAYAVVAHREALREVMERHRLEVRRLEAPLRVVATTQRIASRRRIRPRFGVGRSVYDIEERRGEIELPAGALWIPLDQPGGRFVPLLLEPRSASSLFEEPPYDAWVRPGTDFFVLRVDGR